MGVIEEELVRRQLDRFVTVEQLEAAERRADERLRAVVGEMANTIAQMEKRLTELYSADNVVELDASDSQS